MVDSSRKSMQNRHGLINGGPNTKKDVDKDEIEKSIDRMVYLEVAALGILFGAALALYLIGVIG